MGKSLQFCASCIHFRARKEAGEMKYFCSRLGFETKPKYEFNCWSANERVGKLLEKEKKKD